MWAQRKADTWMGMNGISHYGRALFFLSDQRQFSNFFDLGSYVNEGGFSTVHRCTATEEGISSFKDLGLAPGTQYAVKCMAKKGENEFIEDIGRSIKNLTKERHVEFVRAMQSQQNFTVRLIAIFSEVPLKMFSVMELLEGPDLFGFLSTRRALVPEATVKLLSRQVVNTVHYLHFTVGALHRDIKPENFGFTQPILRGQPLPRMKLMDFGSAWVLPEPVTLKTASLLLDLPPAGTEHYRAPECFQRRSGPQSDVWGVGVIVHMLLCMDLPFGLTQCLPTEYEKAICENQLSFTSKPWRVRSESAKNFTESLLAKDPTERINTLTALDNPWL